MAQFDVEPGNAFPRLVGEQECRNKRDKLTWRNVKDENLIAPIDQYQPHRDSSKRLHEWPGPVHDSCQLVRGALDASGVLINATAHLVLDIEGLHHPQTLNRLLQRFNDASSAREFVARNTSDALDQTAHN